MPVDVRLVAATNRDLRRRGREGRFREDLFYRLNVIEIRIPPLRERREDIPLLAEHFLRRFSPRRTASPCAASPARRWPRWSDYAWPGNVRELENAVERAVVLSRGEVLDVDDLPETVRKGPRGVGRPRW